MTLIYKKPKEKVYTLKERQQHMSWCIKNDITIYPQVQDGWNFVNIIINCRGRKTKYVDEKGHSLFPQLPANKRDRKLGKKEHKWSEIIYKLYTKYYEKYNKQGK